MTIYHPDVFFSSVDRPYVLDHSGERRRDLLKVGKQISGYTEQRTPDLRWWFSNGLESDHLV